MQVEWSLLGMHRRVLYWNISALNKASANTVRDSLDKLFLCWFLCIIDTKDVLSLGWSFEYLFNHSCKISYVDSWDKVLTLSNYWKFLWIL